MFLTDSTISRSEEKCAICLDPLKDRKTLKLHPSEGIFHEFHKSCILSWAAIKNECPLCKRTPAIYSISPVSTISAGIFSHSIIERDEDLYHIYEYIDNNNSLEINRHFSNSPINLLTLEKAIIRAASKGKTEIVSILLSKGILSLNKRSDALKEAIIEGHHDIVCLLIDDEVLSKEFLGYALVEATRYEKTSIVEKILNHSHISLESYGQSLKIASFKLNDEILNLLKTSTVLSPSQKEEARRITLKGFVS